MNIYTLQTPKECPNNREFLHKHAKIPQVRQAARIRQSAAASQKTAAFVLFGSLV
jgi:hypothetical protein